MSSACLNAFCFLALFCLAASLRNVPEGASPSKIHITQRPEPIVRYSDNRAAHVNAQILMPESGAYIDVRILFFYAESDGSLGGYSLYWYVTKDIIKVMEDRDDLKIRVEVEEVPGFMKFDIAIEAQMTGEIQLVATTPGASYERIVVEVLNQQQQIWAEDLNYQVEFLSIKGERLPLEMGEEFNLQCLAYKPYISAEGISLTKDGVHLPASSLTYVQTGRAKAYLSYRLNGYEEGEFECSVRDDTTGAVTSAVVTVVRN